MTAFWSIGVLIASTILSSIGAFLFKVASKDFRFRVASLLNKELIFGIGLYGIAAILTIIAYKGGELTVLVPLGSLNYLWAAFLAQRFLGEEMNAWKWRGVLFIICGIALVGLGDLL
ncbi:MAG TPA: EamA family transporter [Candidatus Nanoarchaeia archaeon]|nr:EamA family transporter [Candidatus Nanoarchaeia archaeon]